MAAAGEAPNPIQLVSMGFRGYGTLPMSLERMDLREFAIGLLPTNLAFSLNQNLDDLGLRNLIESFTEERKRRDKATLATPLNFITSGLLNAPRGPEIWNSLTVDQRQQVVNYAVQYIQPLIQVYNIQLNPALLTAAGIAVAMVPRGEVGVIRRAVDTFNLVRHLPAVQHVENKLRGLGYAQKLIAYTVGGALLLNKGLGLEYLGLDKIFPEKFFIKKDLEDLRVLFVGSLGERAELAKDLAGLAAADIARLKEEMFQITGLNLGELKPQHILTMQETGHGGFLAGLSQALSKDELEEAMIQSRKLAESEVGFPIVAPISDNPPSYGTGIKGPPPSFGAPYNLPNMGAIPIRHNPIDRFYRRLYSLTPQEREQCQFCQFVEGSDFKIRKSDFLEKIKRLGLSEDQLDESIEKWIIDNLRNFASNLVSQPHSKIDDELAREVLAEMKAPRVQGEETNKFYDMFDDTKGKYQAMRYNLLKKDVPDYDHEYLRLQGLFVPFPTMAPLEPLHNKKFKAPREKGLFQNDKPYEPLDKRGKEGVKFIEKELF